MKELKAKGSHRHMKPNSMCFILQGGRTALHYTAQGYEKSMAELLIAKGAYIDATDKVCVLFFVIFQMTV